MARRPESELDKFQWWVNVNTSAREAVIALDDLDDLLAENPGPEADRDWAECKRDLEKANNKLRAVWDHISRVCEEKKNALENKLRHSDAEASGNAGRTCALLAEGNAERGQAAVAETAVRLTDNVSAAADSVNVGLISEHPRVQ